jgi:hypothetical protein
MKGSKIALQYQGSIVEKHKRRNLEGKKGSPLPSAHVLRKSHAGIPDEEKWQTNSDSN